MEILKLQEYTLIFSLSQHSVLAQQQGRGDATSVISQLFILNHTDNSSMESKKSHKDLLDFSRNCNQQHPTA